MATNAQSHGHDDSRAAVSNALNCRLVNPALVIRRASRDGACSLQPDMLRRLAGDYVNIWQVGGMAAAGVCRRLWCRFAGWFVRVFGWGWMVAGCP